ncbi:MAG: Kelch repeat-containing protein [Candidatus Heimdallarchaeaceae archaeon]
MKRTEFYTWAYDYNTNEWTKLITDDSPYANDAKVAYDSESEKIISFGGSHADHVVSNQTWIYDYTENTWVQVTPSNIPMMRESTKMVYDSESDVVIMFGGSLNDDSNPNGVTLRFNDTWSYDYNANTWTNITSATYPSYYWFDSVAYDTESDLVIVFGGTKEANAYLDQTGGAYHGETWSFDYNTNIWDNITPSVSPVPRMGASMVYDSEHDLIILFGGYTHLLRTEIDHETWSFNYNTLSWTELNPDSELERRAYSMAYDSESEKIVLFGGNTGDDPYVFLGDTWVFDYYFNNWTLMPIPEPDDTNAFFIPSILSISIIAIVVMKRRKNS